MNFRTEIVVPKSLLRINHRQQILLLGSCFAENVGKILYENKFNIEINPFGIVYNPASGAKVLKMLLDEYDFTDNDVLYDKGLYFSFMHHSEFSEQNKATYLQKIRLSAQTSGKRLRDLDVLMVTFGTAFVYEWKETGEIVNNCHKLPASMFNRRRLSVAEIVDEWSTLITELLSMRRELKIMFTVSPIRHWKDGAHENQVSKSILLLAIDELQKLFPENIFYFPSYELVLDDLRDYRFYGEDMIHPNQVAIEYCWNKFSETFFDAETQQIIEKWKSISQAIAHRPFRIESDNHQQFLRTTLEKLEKLAHDFPFLDFQKEINQLKSNILA